MKKKILAVILSAMVALSLPTAIVAEAYYDFIDLDKKSSSNSNSIFNENINRILTIVTAIACIFIILAILRAVISNIKKSNSKPKLKKFPEKMIPYDFTASISSFIKENDKKFDVQKFLEWTKRIFCTVQIAWTRRDWEKIRAFEKEELFEQHNKQLQEYIRLGRINVIENIDIIDAYLHKLVVDNNFQNLTVSMRVTMNNYVIDEKSGKVIIGNKKKVIDNIYLLTFTRSSGIKTNMVNGFVMNICHNCGATVRSENAGKCEYCGSIIYTDEFNWVLLNFESVDENFVNDNRGIIFLDGTNQF